MLLASIFMDDRCVGIKQLGTNLNKSFHMLSFSLGFNCCDFVSWRAGSPHLRYHTISLYTFFFFTSLLECCSAAAVRVHTGGTVTVTHKGSEEVCSAVSPGVEF